MIDRDAEDDESGNNASSISMRKKSRDSFSKGESTAHPSQPEKETKKHKQRYMTPKEIYNELRKVWQN